MGKFPFVNLPMDIQCNILSELSIHQLKNMYELVSYDLLFNTFKVKYNNISNFKIQGLLNNFKYNCFICEKILLNPYNLILCHTCSINCNNDIYYPEICDKCSNIKLPRGKVSLNRCPICQQYCTQLGITSYS